MKFTVKSISADDEEEINKKKINWGEKFASKEGLRIDKKNYHPALIDIARYIKKKLTDGDE